MQAWSIEWRSERHQLVKHYTHRPNICAEGIWLGLDNLWREVVWRANHCSCLLHSLHEHFCDSEISNLDKSSLGQEDILTLQVTVDDLPIMDVLHSQANLGEPVKHLILSEWSAPLFFNSVLQVTAYTERQKLSQHLPSAKSIMIHNFPFLVLKTSINWTIFGWDRASKSLAS